MKYFDTIHRGKVKPMVLQDKPKNMSEKKPFYYFYKSSQVVLSLWIVTICVIISQPWIDYWMKSEINKNSGQVLSEATSAPKLIEEIGDSQLKYFYLKNGQVDIRAPIVEGIDDEALKNGIGHHPDSVWPNEKGNVVLAGHNFDLDATNPYGQIFISLRLVQIDDEVVIQYENKKYYYKVFKKETVSSDDESMYSQVDDWILTFYTCDPPYTDWKRLVIQAKLVKIE
jgi:LPXTG-site transpeptidase (sortase) family protein